MEREIKSEFLEIDIWDLLQSLLRHTWAIILAAVIFGAAAFGYATYYITPKYQSSALLFVNNGTFSLDSKVFTISSGSISGASNLVETYVVILKTRMTLNEVIKEANLPYSYETLSGMVSASAVGNTGIFRVTVTSTDPNEAQLIANTIAQVLQIKIADVVDGSSVRVVDYAVMPTVKSSPDVSRYTLIGLLLGAAFVCAIGVIVYLVDTTIHSEDDLKKTADIPILAEIPDLFGGKTHRGGYYKRSRYYNSYSYNQYGNDYEYANAAHHKKKKTDNDDEAENKVAEK